MEEWGFGNPWLHLSAPYPLHHFQNFLYIKITAAVTGVETIYDKPILLHVKYY